METARYSIGWIAPLPLELAASKAALDDDFGDIHINGYIYRGGRIGQHNIVMAVQSKMGTDAASDLAARMHAAFTNIEYFLVVGIGGGVPTYGRADSKSQIVLGDVVVSYPQGSYGGVVRYDFGAWTHEGRLELRGHTNSPPGQLLNAINTLRSNHSMALGTKIPTFLGEIRSKIRVDEQWKFEDQGGEWDRLFENDYPHAEMFSDENCLDCCDLRRSHLRSTRGVEAARDRDAPRIHYGNIASSNQLQISATKRNQLQEELGVICFEMEGAGVIQTHPCLVIRGICDYSDSHKNKKWQPYAAATAAAYAKELLQIIPPNNLAQGTSVTNWARASDLKWFYDALEFELQQVYDDFYSCRRFNHSEDEYLLGFTNSRAFQSWLVEPGSNMWCRLDHNAEDFHSAPGACLVRQATSPLREQVHIFTYRCRDTIWMKLPDFYNQLKSELQEQEQLKMDRLTDHKAKSKPDRESSYRKQDLAEVILVSFLMQAVQKGFKVRLDRFDFSHPQLFINSLVTAFTDSIKSQEGRSIIVIDRLHLVKQKELAAVIGALTLVLSHDQSEHCSIMLASENTPSISLVIPGYPAVSRDSEYQECVQSLYLKDRHLRRGEIAEAVRQSNSWIWTHPSFVRLMGLEAGALAIVGKAGSGKSVLAKTIQRGILTQPSLSRGIIAADWFYCRRKGDFFTAYLSLLISILYEFLARDRALFRLFKSVYRRSPPTSVRSWSIPELEEVLTRLAKSGAPLLMVFDALDEAQDARIVSLVESLVEAPHSKTKVIVLSRPIHDLERRFWSSRRIILQYENRSDIQEIIHEGLSKLHNAILGDFEIGNSATSIPVQQHAALPSRPLTSTREHEGDFSAPNRFSSLQLSPLETALREKSNGVILWVVLVFESLYKYVKKEVTVTVEDLTSFIDRFPSEIDPVYSQMAQELTSKRSESGLRKARAILMWINVASQMKPLTLAELWDAFAIPDTASTPTKTSEGGANAHPVISRREAIRDWNDFHRKLREMCGSFIEIIPDQTNHGSNDSESSNVCDTSVIQLMHQTVKDFLTTSAGAGTLGFSELEAHEMVTNRLKRYVELVLPPETGIVIPFGASWYLDRRGYLSQVATYLEEFRLLEFCCHFLESKSAELRYMQPQSQMIWEGFLPPGGRDPPQTPFISPSKEWVYDIIGSGRISSAIGFMFHFSTSQGFKYSIQNMLGLAQLQNEVSFWDIYQNSILNAVLFTVLDNPDHPKYPKFRKRLIFPFTDSPNRLARYKRREAAILALDHLYDPKMCFEIARLNTRGSKPCIKEIYNAVEAVMNDVSRRQQTYLDEDEFE